MDLLSLQRLAGNRAVTAALSVQRTPDQGSAAGLIDKHTSWGNLDEEALGRALFDLAWQTPSHYSFVVSVLTSDDLGSTDRDDVASAFVRSARDEHLDQFAQTDSGRAMLRRMRDELVGGFAAPSERGEAVRLNNAIGRGEGARVGGDIAQGQLATAEDQARNAPVVAGPAQTLAPEELANRIRLIEAVLERVLAGHPEQDEITQAVAAVRADLTTARGQISSDQAGVSAKVAVAQQVVERCERNLSLLKQQLQAYASSDADQASQPAYIEAAQRVRTRYVEALRGAMSPNAQRDYAVAEASAAALPRALTEIDLSVMENRQAGFTMTNASVADMVEWVRWIRGRLGELEASAQAVAEARRTGSPDLADRQTRFLQGVQIIQSSMEAVQHLERAVRVYEQLAGGFTIIPAAYGSVGKIMQRVVAMRDLAYTGKADELAAAVKKHREDPDVNRFYQAIPVIIAASNMMTGFAIMLVAAAATAGVGSLVAVGEGASLGAIAGSIALETLTFTAVSHGLNEAVGPPTKTPLLLELVMNAGLFSIMRVVGTGVRGALVARELGAVAGVAQQVAAYPVLLSWGTLQFRVEEGRWPTGDELAIMSVQTLVMLAAMTVVSRSVMNMIASHRQLRALETFHAKYGTQVAEIQIERARLTESLRAEIQAGRGDDPAVLEPLRARAAELDAKLRTLVEAVQADPAIGAEALRTAMAGMAEQQAEIGGDLLTKSLDLPERVSLRRGGTGSQYTYEAGTTQILVERLRALGGQVTETADGTGQRTVTAVVRGEPPLYFVERSTPADLQPKLARLAELIQKQGASKGERFEVISQVRTPHGQEPGPLEGFVLDSALAENQRAVSGLIARLTAENPDVIVGLERGGAFWTDVIAAGSRDLAGKVRKMPVQLATGEATGKDKDGKYDGPAMRAQFEQLINDGARSITLVDVYMGGPTARSLRNQIFLPLAQDHPDVRFKTEWVRETMGFETTDAAGGVVLGPNAGAIRPGAAGAGQVTSTETNVRMALGDDMQIVFDPQSREPITIFDNHGRIVRVIQPKAGQTSRDVLIELLNQPPAQ